MIQCWQPCSTYWNRLTHMVCLPGTEGAWALNNTTCQITDKSYWNIILWYIGRNRTIHLAPIRGRGKPVDALCVSSILYSSNTWMRFTYGLFFDLPSVRSEISISLAFSFTSSVLGWGILTLCCPTSWFLAAGHFSLTAFTVYDWGKSLWRWPRLTGPTWGWWT